jgi:hypothetical protein
MTNASSISIRIVLVAAGAFIAFTGIDKALGGIETLGAATNLHKYRRPLRARSSSSAVSRA